jgi:hypothetical protein
MVNTRADEETAAASAAMNRVLEAEREAEQAVAGCEREAQALREAAYAHARRIASRADERISLLRMHWNDRVSRQIEAMERTELAEQQDAAPEPLQPARVVAVVEQLAAELSGGATPPTAVDEGGR